MHLFIVCVCNVLFTVTSYGDLVFTACCRPVGTNRRHLSRSVSYRGQMYTQEYIKMGGNALARIVLEVLVVTACCQRSMLTVDGL